jgi:hypothetical protein
VNRIGMNRISMNGTRRHGGALVTRLTGRDAWAVA